MAKVTNGRKLVWRHKVSFDNQRMLPFGMGGTSKTDEFSEKGGGGIFNPKMYTTDFRPLNRAFEHEI